MQFRNQSKSLVPISQETLLSLCSNQGIDPKRLPKFGKTDERTFPKYIEAITGYPPCPVCNGKVGRIQIPARTFQMHGEFGGKKTFKVGPWLSSPRCLLHPVHDVVKSRPVEEWARMLGPICEHGYYVAECGICIQYACLENIEKAAPIQ